MFSYISWMVRNFKRTVKTFNTDNVMECLVNEGKPEKNGYLVHNDICP